jgi:hypothetical protein
MLALQESSGFEVMKEDELYYINGGSEETSLGSRIRSVYEDLKDRIKSIEVQSYPVYGIGPTASDYQSHQDAVHYSETRSGC